MATIVAPQVYGAIAAVMARMAENGIAKGQRNQQQGYNFRGIDDVYNALSSALSAEKLVMLPRVVAHSKEERQTQKGGTLFYTTAEVEFDLVSAIDGSMHTIKMLGEAMDSGDKSSNKAMSAAFKYAAMQAFCIPTEGDNDADATTHDVSSRKAANDAQVPAISDAQYAQLTTLAEHSGADLKAFCTYFKTDAMKNLTAEHFDDAKVMLEKKLAKKQDKAA